MFTITNYNISYKEFAIPLEIHIHNPNLGSLISIHDTNSFKYYSVVFYSYNYIILKRKPKYGNENRLQIFIRN